MNYVRFLFSLAYIVLQLPFLTVAQNFLLRRNCSNIGNYTANSTYQRNLNSLLSSLASNTQVDYGFYNFSEGQTPDQVNAIALCRGDVSLRDCRDCVSNSTRAILQICPTQKEAIVFYDFCMLRFSNKSIFGVREGSPTFYMRNSNSVFDVNEFNPALQKLLMTLRKTAASGNSTRKFATGEVSAGFDIIYALVQCTPDLSNQQCDDCLVEAIREVPSTSGERRGGRVMKPSCNLRYETYRFYDSRLDEAPPPSPPVSLLRPTEGKKSNKTRTVIIIVVPIAISITIPVICLCIFLRVRNKPMKDTETMDEINSPDSLQFDFGVVKAATNNFSQENKLGQGGFGAVYKGTFYNGQEIAVKRLSKDSGQGDIEFKNEVRLVAKLQHRNLVRLLGFCLEGAERLLIYEFLPNTSLDHFLFDPTKRRHLDWDRRYQIIGGIARGLLYLHEDSRLRVFHRDLKASNILLDEDMNPKIADFGMAKLIVMDQSQVNTSRIVGTYGYMAPEYAMHGQFSVKSDVFSFGVLLLEIVSGQKNNSFRNGENVEDLLSYAWKNWREGTSQNVIDPSLRTGSRNEMMRCIHIGLLCVQENVADRPTMASIALMLNSHSLSLAIPSQPAFFIHTTTQSDLSSSMGFNSRETNSSSQAKSEILPLSINETSITELHPR